MALVSDALTSLNLIWSGEFFPVIQSNARFGVTDRLEVHLYNVRIPAGNGKRAEKTKGRTLNVLSTIENSIVVKAALLGSAHALIISVALVNGDLKLRIIQRW